jgi:hypothetical protein
VLSGTVRAATGAGGRLDARCWSSWFPAMPREIDRTPGFERAADDFVSSSD